MQIISLILAIAKTIPIIDKWLGKLVAAYQTYRKKEIQEATKRAINEAIKTQDQRPVESDQTSGKPSGMGTIRDHLPGVELRIKKPD